MEANFVKFLAMFKNDYNTKGSLALLPVSG